MITIQAAALQSNSMSCSIEKKVTEQNINKPHYTTGLSIKIEIFFIIFKFIFIYITYLQIYLHFRDIIQ